MEVTRNVIMDLLPLYLAGEASTDTTTLVENYLKTDPELARLAEQASRTSLAEVPVPLSKESAMKAFEKATQRILYRTLAVSALIVIAVLSIIVLVLYFGFGLR